MTNKNHNISLMIVSMDAGGFSLPVMSSAMTFASQLQADLCGLFIENSELLELANLPFTREVTLHTAKSRDLSGASMEGYFNVAASQMRHAMEELAKAFGVSCSFRTARGPRLQTVIKESGDSQLVMLMPRKRLTEYRRQYVATSNIRPIVLFYDGTAQAHRAIKMLNSMNGDPAMKWIHVLTTSQCDETEILDQFSPAHYRVKLQYLQDFNLSDMLNRDELRPAGLLILPMEDKWLEQEVEVNRLLDLLSCPLILVR